MIDIDMGEIERLEQRIKRVNEVAWPIAVQAATNSNAFTARRLAIDEIGGSMTLRNKWTTGRGALEVQKSPRVRQIDRVRAVLGATRAYLATQEFGGLDRDSWIPTTYASNEGESAPVRRRLPIKSRARRGRNVRGVPRGVPAPVAIREAKADGSKFIRLRLSGGRVGVMQIKGTKKNPIIKMVADVTDKPRHIPARPWLQPALKRAEKFAQANYVKALQFQAERAFKS